MVHRTDVVQRWGRSSPFRAVKSWNRRIVRLPLLPKKQTTVLFNGANGKNSWSHTISPESNQTSLFSRIAPFQTCYIVHGLRQTSSRYIQQRLTAKAVISEYSVLMTHRATDVLTPFQVCDTWMSSGLRLIASQKSVSGGSSSTSSFCVPVRPFISSAKYPSKGSQCCM